MPPLSLISVCLRRSLSAYMYNLRSSPHFWYYIHNLELQNRTSKGKPNLVLSAKFGSTTNHWKYQKLNSKRYLSPQHWFDRWRQLYHEGIRARPFVEPTWPLCWLRLLCIFWYCLIIIICAIAVSSSSEEDSSKSPRNVLWLKLLTTVVWKRR